MARVARFGNLWLALWWACLGAAVALHFVHLRADFPNFSPWMDYAKYTDEGWYGNAALRQALLGHWRMPGDFNPAVALPVWPLLLRGAFALGGVSLVTARVLGLGVYVGNLLLSYSLLRRFASRTVSMAGVSFLAGSAYLWAFSRLAILEPLLVFFLLASWLTVLAATGSRAGSEAGSEAEDQAPRRRLMLLLATGLLLALAVLTKTTAVFLFPSTVYLLWRGNAGLLRKSCQDSLLIAAGGLLPWGAYYVSLMHAHLGADYHYLFAANRWTQPTTASGWFWAFWYALHGALWVDPALCGLAVSVLLLSLFAGRPRLWREPLAGAALLASAGYIFFTGWHNNPQPRYYEVVAYPLVFLSCLGAASLARAGEKSMRLLGALAWAVFAATTLWNLVGTLRFVRHPDYTLVRAARGVTRYIDRHPNGRRLLLSISGDQIMLITHLPAICDDFGSTDLPYRIHQYQPGWYAAWNEIDPGTLEDLHTQFRLEQVAKFHAFDDEDRDVLILYKLHPLPPARARYNAEEEAAANKGQE